jgi:hypothetical protein
VAGPDRAALRRGGRHHLGAGRADPGGVPKTGRRFSVNVMAAISNKGELYFTCYTGAFHRPGVPDVPQAADPPSGPEDPSDRGHAPGTPAAPVRQYFNHLEDLAAGVKQGIFDLEALALLSGSRIVDTVESYANYIAEVRQELGRPSIYENIEELAHMLRQYQISRSAGMQPTATTWRRRGSDHITT